jgi:hypothetical protein
MGLSRDATLKAAMALEKARSRIAQKRFTIGFDGFVDEILHAVATRQSLHEYDRISTLSEFSDRVRSAAGKSANVEVVPIQVKMGGNGPLMSMAVGGMGGKVTCIGLLGDPEIHPAFHPLQEKAKLFSLGNPGRTDALEFQDGKLMLGKLDTIRDVRWERLQDVVGPELFRSLILDAELVACTNWTMIPAMSDILDHITQMIPPEASVCFFFDLADPEKRSREDLIHILGQIRALNTRAKCILGLNFREAEQVSQALDLKKSPEETALGMESAARLIAKATGLHGVVVHAIKYAGAYVGDEGAHLEGPYSPTPKLSTGAGDHFNGGFVSGWMGGLSVLEALFSGVGASGWYVRNARSPSLQEVVDFLKRWGTGQPLD